MISAYLLRYRPAFELPRAVYHWIRLAYYTAALQHVGHTHADAPHLTRCCIDSQRVVDAFLEARSQPYE